MEFGINNVFIPLLATVYLLVVYTMLRVVETQGKK